jgi:hypothetical protein
MVYDLIGFTEVERERLRPHLPNLRVFYGMTTSSLEALETNLARASPNQRVIINMYRAQLLHGLMYWVQDQCRVNRDPEQAHVLVLEMLEEANDLATYRTNVKENSATTGASTDPGTFRENDDFYVWANSMYNHLCTQLGAMGVPLNYVIRPNATPQFDIDDDPMTQSIKTAPLYGTKYIADAATVHSIIVGKVADRAAAWISTSTRTNNNGRDDMTRLYNHYTGNGNQMARVAQADATYKTLHYKDERQFSFNRFIHSAQQMFDIYAASNRKYTDDRKIDFLLDRLSTSPAISPHLPSLQMERNRGPLRYDDLKSLVTTIIAQQQATNRTNVRISNVQSNRPSSDRPNRPTYSRRSTNLPKIRLSTVTTMMNGRPSHGSSKMKSYNVAKFIATNAITKPLAVLQNPPLRLPQILPNLFLNH